MAAPPPQPPSPPHQVAAPPPQPPSPPRLDPLPSVASLVADSPRRRAPIEPRTIGPKPVEQLAHDTMDTIRSLVAATGGRFTETTIPPRLVGRLAADVARVREELENRRAERYASGSTAGKRRAIENWFEERASKERRVAARSVPVAFRC